MEPAGKVFQPLPVNCDAICSTAAFVQVNIQHPLVSMTSYLVGSVIRI